MSIALHSSDGAVSPHTCYLVERVLTILTDLQCLLIVGECSNRRDQSADPVTSITLMARFLPIVAMLTLEVTFYGGPEDICRS